MTPLAIETSNRYFALGYVVIAIMLIAIVGTLIVRSRRLHRDYMSLLASQSQDQDKSPIDRRSTPQP